MALLIYSQILRAVKFNLLLVTKKQHFQCHWSVNNIHIDLIYMIITLKSHFVQSFCSMELQSDNWRATCPSWPTSKGMRFTMGLRREILWPTRMLQWISLSPATMLYLIKINEKILPEKIIKYQKQTRSKPKGKQFTVWKKTHQELISIYYVIVYNI